MTPAARQESPLIPVISGAAPPLGGEDFLFCRLRSTLTASPLGGVDAFWGLFCCFWLSAPPGKKSFSGPRPDVGVFKHPCAAVV